MIDGAAWLERARAIVEATRPLLDNYGLAPAPRLTVALDGHPCPGYRHDTGQILFCPPVIESNRDKLRWLFFCRVMGCVDVADAEAFYEVALPLIVCHELAHHLRFTLGVQADSSFIEEQVCDRIAVALVERLPGYAPTLGPLVGRCRAMRARLGEQYRAGAGSEFLPGLGEALVARRELEPERLQALEALAATSDASMIELLEVAVGAEAVAAVRASRDDAQVMVDSRYTEDPSEYWYLSLTWIETYLGRARGVDLQDVVRDHLSARPLEAAPTLPSRTEPVVVASEAEVRAMIARVGATMALANELPERALRALARRQLGLEAQRLAVRATRELVRPELAEATAVLLERGDPRALAAVDQPWRDELVRALRGEGYTAGSSESLVVRAASLPEEDMLTMIERALALESVELFAHLPPDRLWQLAERAVDEVIEPGEAVFREGEDGRRLFLILDGRVRIEKGDGAGAIELAVLGRGASFGEMALFDGRPRSATARAIEACRVRSVDRGAVERLGREYSEVYEALLRALSGRLRATSELLEGSLSGVPTG